VDKIKHTTLGVKLGCNPTLNVTVLAVHLIQMRNDHAFNFRLKLEQVEACQTWIEHSKLKMLQLWHSNEKLTHVFHLKLKLEQVENLFVTVWNSLKSGNCKESNSITIKCGFTVSFDLS